MYCCPECFDPTTSQTLISIIQDLSAESGTCDICKAEMVEVVHISEISENFQQLFDIYRPDNSSQSDSKTFESELIDKWNIFSEKARPKIRVLLKEVVSTLDDNRYEDILQAKKVKFAFEDDDTFERDWYKFKKEIREQNRYFFKSFKPRELEEIMYKNEVRYNAGTDYYRARICDDSSGLQAEEMQKPPWKRASAGRANPVGIPYLYLSHDKETVLHEVRATHKDYVTIATYQLNADLKISSLTPPGFYDQNPFMEDGNLNTTLAAVNFLSILEKELAKPMRRSDSELEYLPTQYICELAKNLGFDGIEYKSTIYPVGMNVAVFSDDNLEIIKTETVEIDQVNVISKPVDES